jgi:hypothetical protein
VNSLDDMKRAVWICSSALMFVLASCAVTIPRADHYVAPPLDSTWVNARRDTGSFGSGSAELRMTRGERMWNGARLVSFETSEGALLTTPSGDYVAQVRDERALVTWDPPYNLNWPLEVGKSWVNSYRMTIHAAKRTVPYEIKQKVEAYEEVKTPAGTFKAFKVHSTDTLGNDNTVWISPELGIFVKQILRRTDKHAQGVGTRDMEVISVNIHK